MSEFGTRLKELRKDKHLTQKQLADILFIDDTSISKYENGKVIPENSLLQRIADFFNVTTDYLLGRVSSETNKTEFPLYTEQKKNKATQIINAIEESGIELENMNIDILKALLVSYKMLENKK